MRQKLDILKQSLKKKEELINAKINTHFATVKQANGQPLNDKRNGQATMNRWERQNDGIRTLQKSIDITKHAIEIEERKIKYVEHINLLIPVEILKLVETGELIQWKKYPNTFFVSGIDNARIVWLIKRKLIAHKYTDLITIQEQRTKFARIYNPLNTLLNGKK